MTPLVKIFDTPSINFLHNIINIIYKNKDDAVHLTDESINKILKGELLEKDNPSEKKEEDIYEEKPNDYELDEKAVEFKNNIRELIDIVIKSTGQAIQYVEGQIKPCVYKDIDLKEFISKIKQSDFLMGRCKEKPRVAHFTWQPNIISVMSGNYDNREKLIEQPISKDPSRKMLW